MAFLSKPRANDLCFYLLQTMKIFSIICLLAFNVAAYDSIYASFFANLDCTGDLEGGVLFKVISWFDIQPFQSFQFSRSMLSTEQVDFSAEIDCSGFLESV